MSNVSILHEIYDHANRMEDAGIVDPDIVLTLKKLQGITKNIESKWITIQNPNSFYFYNAIKNVELIIDKMIDRFYNAKEMHDNPQVAVDTLRLIPNLIDVIEITESNETSEEVTEKVIEYTYKLRNKASETNLLESEDVDLQGIDNEKVMKVLNGMVEELNIPKELPDDVSVDDESIS